MSARRGSYPVAVECPLDPRWMTIGARLHVPPFAVSGVWQVVMMHAATSLPRGRVVDLNVADLATFNACDETAIEAILAEFRARNMIAEDGRVVAWAELIGAKKDPTGAARQQRHRDRKRESRNAVTRRDTPRHVTAVTRDTDPCHARNERDEKGGDMGGFALTTAFSPEKLSTPNQRSVARALARDEIIEELDRQQAGGGYGWTIYAAKHIAAMLKDRVTLDELRAAIERAKSKRTAEGSKQRVNAGLVAVMLTDIRARLDADTASQPRSIAGHSPPAPAESPLQAALAQIRHLHHLGVYDDARRDAEIEAARQRLGGGLPA